MRNSPRVERGYSSRYPNENKWDILSDKDRPNRQIDPERVRQANRANENYMKEEDKPNSPLQKVKEFALSPTGLGIIAGIFFAATVVLGTQDPSTFVTENPLLATAALLAGSGLAGVAFTGIATDAYAKEDSEKHRAERERRNGQ